MIWEDGSAKLVPLVGVSTRGGPAATREMGWRFALRRSVALARDDYFADRSRKILHASARNDNRVATAVSFFGDAQELPAIVLAELDMKDLALDLHFPCLDNAIHFRSAQSRPRAVEKGR